AEDGIRAGHVTGVQTCALPIFYAAADRDRSIRGRRWSVEHFFSGRPDHYPRVKALELVISAQDHLYRAGPSSIKYWGRERAEQRSEERRVGKEASGRGAP